jgi:hypothetical protein
MDVNTSRNYHNIYTNDQQDGNPVCEGIAGNLVGRDYHQRKGIKPHGEYQAISLMKFL